jgi:hypothetical protein
VWSIPSEPLKVPDSLGVEHFAAFPTEIPRRIILGWSPKEVCTGCGAGKRPVVEKELDTYHDKAIQNSRYDGEVSPHTTFGHLPAFGSTVATITGYECDCDGDAPTTPGIVLDPFGGTGTTAAVANALGRVGVSVDLSHDYCRLAKWRVTDPATRAKVLRVAKPKPEADGQLSMV